MHVFPNPVTYMAVQTIAIGQYIAFFDKSMSHSLVGLLYK